MEEVFTTGNLAVGDELCAGSRHETLERIIFGLALALAPVTCQWGGVSGTLVSWRREHEHASAVRSAS